MMHKASFSWRRLAALTLFVVLTVPMIAACGGSAPATETNTNSSGSTNTSSESTNANANAGGAEANANTNTNASAGGEATSAPAAGEATSAPATGSTGGKGGTLKILYWQAITILNGHQSSGTKDYDGSSVVLEPLAHYDENGKAVPALAEEVPTIENGGIAKDYSTVTWKLKQGVKWSDGTDFTADDVIFTWQYCADPATACTTKANFDPIKTVEAIDPHTVKITWKEPNPDPYIAFVSYNGLILQKKQFQNCIGDKAVKDQACQAANNNPIGTNAWMVDSFKPGDVVTYKRNPLYRDADKVFFDNVEIKGGGDATSAARAVCQTGEVDFAWNLQVPANVLDQILAGGKCDPVNSGSFGIERIVLNFSNPSPDLGDKRGEPDTKNPFFSDLKVRQAVALAIDRKTIVDQVNGKLAGKQTCNLVTQPPDIDSPNTKCDQDVEKAKQLLDEAGWKDDGSGVRSKDGKKLELLFQTSTNPLRQQEQAVVKQSLAKVGITVNLKAVDASVFFGNDKANPDTLGKLWADMQMYTNSPSDPIPISYLDGFTCANASAKSNGWNYPNDGRYCNADYDAVIAQMKKETDSAKLKDLFIKANDILVNDVAAIALVDRTTPQGKSKDLKGPTGSTFDSQLWNIQTWSK
jgi:peptide/nickel transport system substrate-binding protein